MKVNDAMSEVVSFIECSEESFRVKMSSRDAVRSLLTFCVVRWGLCGKFAAAAPFRCSSQSVRLKELQQVIGKLAFDYSLLLVRLGELKRCMCRMNK